MSKNDFNSRFVQLPLNLCEVVIRLDCKTGDLYEELRPKLGKNHDRGQIMQKLDRLARAGKDFELSTKEGEWLARTKGKTETGYYLWTLYFRPDYQSVA